MQAPPDPVQTLLSRPREQRAREYKYRFSQSVVFGLPVLFLHYFGAALGPLHADRWTGALESLLAGWILYVNLGMLFEGILLLGRRRLTADLFIITVAAALYVASVISWLHIFFSLAHALWYPLLFHIAVILLVAWTGARWWLSHRPFEGSQ